MKVSFDDLDDMIICEYGVWKLERLTGIMIFDALHTMRNHESITPSPSSKTSSQKRKRKEKKKHLTYDQPPNPPLTLHAE